MDFKDAVFKSKRALIVCGKVLVSAGLCLLKLPFQLISAKRPDIFIDSIEGHRYPVYLSLSLASEFVLEIRMRHVLFFYRYLPFRDFLFGTVVLLPGKNPASPLVLSLKSSQPFPSKQTITIDGDYYTALERPDSQLIMPYFAHPEFYRKGLHLKASGFQSGSRPYRIFFCGSVLKEEYSRDFHFHILNRYEIMDYISSHFADHITHSMERTVKPIVFLITNDPRDTVRKHQLAPAEYFQALKRADFFIAAPGCKMPHCHNIIEAMTAGAIPITNYAHVMHPPLQNGVNCLSFTDYESLSQALTRAMSMSAEVVDLLRKGTLNHHQNYLKPSAFGANFRRSCSTSTTLFVNEER